MQAALHHDRGATEGQRLFHLAMDLALGQQVALPAARSLVEGAELAGRDAVVGVVDVAVDNEGDLALRVQTAAHFVGPSAEHQQISRLKHAEGLAIAETAHSRPGGRWQGITALGRGCSTHGVRLASRRTPRAWSKPIQLRFLSAAARRGSTSRPEPPPRRSGHTPWTARRPGHHSSMAKTIGTESRGWAPRQVSHESGRRQTGASC